MTSAISNIVQSIHDGKQAQIKISLLNGEHRALGCIYKEDKPPHFYLVFPPDKLPDNIDTDANHPVAVMQDSSTISLNSNIIEIPGDRRLYLVATEKLDPSSLREYFRVNTSTDIRASYDSRHSERTSASWSIDGITQDLSGSGVLAQFLEEPKNKDNIQLDIFLARKRISVTGHIVRKKKLRNKRWQISFHFDNISNKNRDEILAFLLSEQRRQLRENVATRD